MSFCFVPYTFMVQRTEQFTFSRNKVKRNSFSIFWFEVFNINFDYTPLRYVISYLIQSCLYFN
jgi:translation initiation factor 2B subunit (eIF-2B alpha/beta/delta family)